MRTQPDSIPYALEQVLNAARLVSEDEWIHWKVLTRVLRELADEMETQRSSSEIIFACMATANKALGVSDPYENEKARSNKVVMALEEKFRERIEKSDNRLATAAHFALCGVAVGSGVEQRGDAAKLLDEAADATCARDDSEALVRALTRAESVFYILNNSGEAVLDKLFIEELASKLKVTVAMRFSPILNDVTRADATALGLDKIENVELTDPGTPMLGLWLEKCDKQLRETFENADVVISKGQSNYESLADAEREIFFLLRARSVSVARDLGVAPGSPVLFRHEGAVASNKSGEDAK